MASEADQGGTLQSWSASSDEAVIRNGQDLIDDVQVFE
jgi:hypothetical protein